MVTNSRNESSAGLCLECVTCLCVLRKLWQNASKRDGQGDDDSLQHGAVQLFSPCWCGHFISVLVLFVTTHPSVGRQIERSIQFSAEKSWFDYSNEER